MPSYSFSLVTVIQHLENGLHVAESLLIPEIVLLGNNLDDLLLELDLRTSKFLKELSPDQLAQRMLAVPAVGDTFALPLSPPKRSADWQEELTTHFPMIRWDHLAHKSDGSEHFAPDKIASCLAYVPVLGITVYCESPEDMEQRLKDEIRAALLRTEGNKSLESLARLQRCHELTLQPRVLDVNILSAKQRAREREDSDKKSRTELKKVATNLTITHLPAAYELDDVLNRLADLLTGRNPRSVLLVGPSGVGKTALVGELVRRRKTFGLGTTTFWSTGGARLVAGMTGFGMWQERCRKVWQEASSERAILHLGNLMELTEVGKSEHQHQGIASFFRPYIARGDVLVLCECTPEQYTLLERIYPGLLDVFARLDVKEPDLPTGLRILEQFALASRSTGDLPIEPDALAQIDRLHRRYATYSAYPGRPLRFLNNLLVDQARKPEENPPPLSTRDITLAFARETGLPLVLLDDNELLDLEDTFRWLAARVIGQQEPVELVVDMLATVKAGLNRPGKPIASLLFIGPTGVGKTEMAKSLATFLFGSPDRLTRFDMSEYADPQALQRLTGGPFQREGLLTGKVREQPFSVILLDEVEKAHPQFFDLLLQVLGEGRLTDGSGHLADFQCSVVIMTSNLGAESFQQGGLGLVQTQVDIKHARDHFTEAVQKHVRPELFNRIDRVVPFTPLDADTIRFIANRQLELIRQRDGLRYRQVEMGIDDEVCHWLADKGYDPRYGARPLKRAMEREFLAPLAKNLNRYQGDLPLQCSVSLEDHAPKVQVSATDSGPASAFANSETEMDAIQSLLQLRREMQQIQRNHVGIGIYNTIYQLETLQKRHDEKHRLHPDEVTQLNELPRWKKIRDTLETLFGEVCSLEDETLLNLYSLAEIQGTHLKVTCESIRNRWEQWMLEMYLLSEQTGNDYTIVLFSEDSYALLRLAEAYYRVVTKELSGSVQVWQFLPADPNRPKSKETGKPSSEKSKRESIPQPERRNVISPDDLFSGQEKIIVSPWDLQLGQFLSKLEVRAMDRVIGLALRVECLAASARLQTERGVHIYERQEEKIKIWVDTTASDVQDYKTADRMDRKGAIPGEPKRRVYSWVSGMIHDHELKTYCPLLKGGEMYKSLADLIQQSLKRRVWELLQ